jgi:arylsulfatase A-like enzyme
MYGSSRNCSIFSSVTIVIAFCIGCVVGTPRKNVLLIVVDDLRPQLGAYGLDFMHTPNMDRLASEGTVFDRAYVQIAICSPTRNSFMSGRNPDKTKVWNFMNHFREAGVGDAWTVLPEFFRKQGYFTTGAGKLFHHNMPPDADQERSWSEKWYDNGNCECGGHGFPPKGQATCEGLDPASLSCGDDDIVERVIAQLGRAKKNALGNSSQPWFIGAGLHKPHASFYGRPEDFAKYPDPAPPVPDRCPKNMPYVAWHSCLSHAPGFDYSDWGQFTDIPNNMTLSQPMNSKSAARLRRGYYGSVTYTDSNVGKILAAAEPMLEDTVVALIGDHGWSLGEQNVWCKMTNFENAVRVPFIIRAPWAQARPGLRVGELVEAVDLYRTLADLSGVGEGLVENGVDGVSLLPLLKQPATPLRGESKSVYPRCFWDTLASNPTTESLPMLDRTDCQDVPRESFDLMGYSIRTKQWRFTEWRRWNGKKLDGDWEGAANATELYDHRSDGADPFSTETENLAEDPTYEHIVRQLRTKLRNAFASERDPSSVVVQI